MQGLDQVSGNSEIEGITSYSYVDRYTPPGVLGLVKGWDNPAWIDNRHTMVFNPGADEFPGGVNVAYHELGHAEPERRRRHAPRLHLVRRPGRVDIVFGDITRKGDKLAVGEDGFAATRTIRLYSVAARPPYQGRRAGLPLPARNPPGGRLRIGHLVARREILAYQAGGNIYTVHIGSIATGCAARQAAPARPRRHLPLLGTA